MLRATIALGLLAVFGFAQTASAQDPPLNFAQNYFLRGGFVVAGAYNLTSSFTVINGEQYAVGTINIPDNQNVGITGQKMVPPGGEPIAVELWWQTAEKLGLDPGQPGSGKNGYFRPIINGGPKAPGYSITGVALTAGGSNTVSWSTGGCTSGSTGKVVRTYRANVVSLMPRDQMGDILANGKYEVRLPGTTSTTPIAVSAWMVVIYRVIDPTAPYESIVIYDGDSAPSATSPTMMQTMHGFYDAATTAPNTSYSLTHMVGNGKSKKLETVYLNDHALPSLYPASPGSAFPGFYGSSDIAQWTFGPNSNLVDEHAASVTTMVVPNTSQQGCVDWGVVIFSTTINNTDGDGLPDAVKKIPAGYTNPGYADPTINDGVCTPGDPKCWVDLPGAVLGTPRNPHPDVYVQYDYMCSSPIDGINCKTGDGTNYSFNPTLQTDPSDGKTAVDKVKAVYLSHGITLHVNEQGNQPNVHAIQEPFCTDNLNTLPPALCVFPHPSSPAGNTINFGVVPWPGGVNAYEQEFIDKDDPTNLGDCTTSPPAADCVPRFQPGAAPFKHYGLFARAVGQQKWSIYNGTVVSVTQTGNKVTFTMSGPVGALNVLGPDSTGITALDPSCEYGRVTVNGVFTSQKLDNTFCLDSPGPQGNSFTITVGGSPTNASYTADTDPNLIVVPPYTSTASGIADVGGHHFVVSLGLWGNPALSTSDGQNPAVIASTLAHEEGHAIFSLAHGGPAARALANPPLFQSVTTNCKVNYLSVMSYSRQLDLLDYSESALADIDKVTLSGSLSGVLDITHWYVPWPAARDAHNNPIGSPATLLCSGPPIPAGEAQMTEVTGPASTFSFASLSGANTDINFDGNPYPNTNENFLGACDWCNYDLAQTDATGSYLGSSGPPFGGGGPPFGGGGPPFGGGGPPFGGGGPPFGGGGPPFGGGGPPFGGGGEIDLRAAQSVTPAPQNLAASEGASPRTITLTWSKPFGDIGAYNVYRATNGGAFTIINAAGTNPPHTVVGNPPVTAFTDTVTCNPTGYQYLVTAVQSASSTNPGAESTPSNIVTTGQNSELLTACYIVTAFSAPPNAIQGSQVLLGWTLTDNSNKSGSPVTRQAANTLVAIGPLPGTCTTSGRSPLLTNGIPTTPAVDIFSNSSDQFTFTWNNTDAFCAGSYTFELDLDSGQSQTTSAFQLGVDVTDTDSTPHITTSSVPNGVVGSLYSDTISEDGGVTGGPHAFAWTISSVTRNGSNVAVIPGISLTLAPDGVSGLLSGTPTQPGAYSFTAMVTDSAGNVGTQTLTLNIADALYGDLIVVDGNALANPLAGTLFRVTPTGTSGTIAAVSTGQPTGVGVDSTSGNLYVAVAPVAGTGTPGVTQVGPFGAANSTFASGGVLKNPVAVAVDSSGNVYVGDNQLNAIYEFSPTGTHVGNGAFATLPSSSGVPNHIRMAFDSSGNLDVASDNIGGVAGQIEVDQIANGVLKALYSTSANGSYSGLSIAQNASGGSTTYSGSFSVPPPVGSSITIAGFTANPNNNGTFTVLQGGSTSQLFVNNANGIAETPNPNNTTGTLQLTVGGIAVLSGGSIDVADYTAQAIYNITNPGVANMAITTVVGPAASLCCNISGMANPPSSSLYLTLNGSTGGTPQLVAVSSTPTVSTLNSTQTYALTAVSASNGTTTTYTGTFSPTIRVNAQVTISGFTSAANNGPFTVVSCTGTTLVLSNGSGVAETNPGAAVAATPLTYPNDVAWYSFQSH